jgi:4-hydroxy-3-methylbut-2-en-1-yl diphosphate synthase IspG/GcpE
VAIGMAITRGVLTDRQFDKRRTTMQKNKQCCILWFIDDDKKKYNPGLILTEDATDQEISDIIYKMREEGRNVRIFTSHLVDSIDKLPPLDQPIGDRISDYEYDPFLIW